MFGPQFASRSLLSRREVGGVSHMNGEGCWVTVVAIDGARDAGASVAGGADSGGVYGRVAVVWVLAGLGRCGRRSWSMERRSRRETTEHNGHEHAPASKQASKQVTELHFTGLHVPDKATNMLLMLQNTICPFPSSHHPAIIPAILQSCYSLLALTQKHALIPSRPKKNSPLPPSPPETPPQSSPRHNTSTSSTPHRTPPHASP